MKTNNNSYLKNTAIMLAWWIAIMLLVASALWGAEYYRKRYYAQAVNAILDGAGDGRHVKGILPTWGRDGRPALNTSRFMLDDLFSRAIIFSVNYGSLSCTFTAFWRSGEGIEAIRPLNDQAAIAAERLPAGIVELYAARIAAVEYELPPTER